MKYLSVCSGIEAASVAWHSLGWKPLAFSEIEPFPRAVLAHHYPDVPCHGDFTVLRDQPWIVDADVLVGGTPCQAFSVAGLRNSLSDERGNLSLEFVRLADAIDAVRSGAGREPGVIVWENVPGVLSVKDNAFGCFLAALAGDVTSIDPPRGKWSNAGVVDGPQRKVAWRILDAQYFGLAQRRRRVFVVASARDGFDPAAVLLEFESVRRDTPPRRETGKGTAHATAPCLTSSGRGVERTGDTRGQDPVVAVMEDPVPPLMARSSRGGAQTLSPGHQTDGHMVAIEQPVIMSSGQANAEIRTDGGAPVLTCLHEAPIIAGALLAGGHTNNPLDETLVTHALRAEGFDASEDGTGRGTPLVPVQAFYSNESRCDNIPPPGLSPPLKVGSGGTSGNPPAVAYAFSCKDSGNDATLDLSPTLRAMPHHGSHANGGGQMGVAYAFQPRIARNGRGDMGDVVNALNAQSGETGKGDAAPCVAVAFHENQRAEITMNDTAGSLKVAGGKPGQGYPAVMQHMAVRRLTPVECERLQGFPDSYTMIPWRGKPAADCPDGPRYKALGNSMAVPVMRWIGNRISQHLRGEI